MPKVTIAPPAAARPRFLTEFGEKGAVAEHVIGREHRDHRLRVILRGERRSDGDRWPAIPAHRLQHDRRLGSDLLQLFGNDKAIGIVGDDDRLGEDFAVAEHANDRLKRRFLAD